MPTSASVLQLDHEKKPRQGLGCLWWYVPVITAFGRKKQGKDYKFKPNPVYRVRFRPACKTLSQNIEKTNRQTKTPLLQNLGCSQIKLKKPD